MTRLRTLAVLSVVVCLCNHGFAQQITGSPATVNNAGADAGSRTMNLYTVSAGGGVTGNVHPTTTIPTHFGSIGQSMAIVFNPVPPNTNQTDNGAGMMTGSDFMFSATTAAAALPTSQPTSLVFSAITPTSFNVSFTATSSPAGYLVLRKAGSAVTASPSVGFSYTVNSILSDATVAYVGTATSFSETALTPGTNYFYTVFPFNGSGGTTNYLITAPLSNNQFTLATEPTSPPSFLTFTAVATTSLTVSFNDASPIPTGYITIRKAGSAPTGVPVDGTTYTVGGALGDATVVSLSNSNSIPETGLTPSTTYFYIVYSYNGDVGSYNYLTTGSANGSQQTPAGDTTVPVINSTTPLSVDPATDLTVKATVTENESTISTVSLDYRSVSGAATFTTVPMVLSSTSWEFKIPAAQIGELGIEYKITATNSVSLAGTFSGRTAILHKSGLILTDTDLPPGDVETKYRIVAFPFILASNTVGDIFNQLGTMVKDWRVYHYQAPGPTATEWKQSNLLLPGQGYWVIRRNGTDISILGDTQGTTVPATLDQPFTVDLAAGWNQIGNPYLFNVLWSDVKTASNVTFALRTYNGAFSDADKLNKFEGGFVFAAASTTLKFPVAKNPAAGGRTSATAKAGKTNAIDGPEWEVALKLSNGDHENVFGGVGMRKDAQVNYDAYDDFTLPRFQHYLELNHIKELHRTPYTKDIVPSEDNHTWEFVVESSLTGESQLTWDNSYFGKNSKGMVLWDEEIQRAVDMRTVNGYRFEAPRNFKLIYGNEKYIKELTAINSVLLHTAFPNPTDGKVSIGFSIPDRGSNPKVVVRLANQLGQVISTVHDGELAPGFHEVVWDGLDNSGVRPAQGVYFIQVAIGEESKIKRIVVK